MSSGERSEDTNTTSIPSASCRGRRGEEREEGEKRRIEEKIEEKEEVKTTGVRIIPRRSP